jgi:hypothetical protein
MWMVAYRGQDYRTPVLVEVEVIGPGAGRVACFECGGDPEAYAAAFAGIAGIDGCVDCKNRGWVPISIF